MRTHIKNIPRFPKRPEIENCPMKLDSESSDTHPNFHYSPIHTDTHTHTHTHKGTYRVLPLTQEIYGWELTSNEFFKVSWAEATLNMERRIPRHIVSGLSPCQDSQATYLKSGCEVVRH